MLKFFGLTGALRADAGVVSVGMVRTPDVTPVPSVLGAGITASHSFGTVPSIAILEYVCLTAEQGFSIGDVFQVTANWNGAALYPNNITKTTSSVISQSASGYIFAGLHKTTGSGFTPTAANWAYRFVLIK